MKYVNNILKEFVDECSKKLNLKSIIQFGSSTYSKNFNDIDLILFSNELIFSTRDYKKLFGIIKILEKRYKDISFNFGKDIKGKVKYPIAITTFQRIDLTLNTDPFIIKNIFKDKNKKILFGKNPFKEIKISKNEIISRVIKEKDHTLREYSDGKIKVEFIYYLFKSVITLMLTNENVSEKDKLLDSFKVKYPNLNLPKNAQRIINGKILSSDFYDVLKFVEDCLKYLIK